MRTALSVLLHFHLLLCPLLATSPIHLLPGGLSGARNFHIISDEEQYVLRWLDVRGKTSLERLKEIQGNMIASQLGIGPKIFTTFSDESLLMEYINGTPTTKEDTLSPKFIANIKKLHGASESIEYHETFFDFVRKRLNTANTEHIPLPTQSIRLMLKKMDKIEKQLDNTSTVFCHNDLHAGNVIKRDDDYYFIDWTDCSMGDPFQEIGYIAAVYNLSKEEKEALLSAYLGHYPSEEETIHFEAQCLMSLLRIFTSNFIAFEPPAMNSDVYEKRCTELDAIVAGNTLKPYESYIGKLDSDQQVIHFSLSCLKYFLEHSEAN